MIARGATAAVCGVSYVCIGGPGAGVVGLGPVAIGVDFGDLNAPGPAFGGSGATAWRRPTGARERRRGMVSHLRSYTVAELKAMTAGLGGEAYVWEAGRVEGPGGGPPVTYLLGSVLPGRRGAPTR